MDFSPAALRVRSGRVEQRRHDFGAGHEFPQDLWSLPCEFESELDHPGDVSARTIEARNQPELNGIAADVEDDGNGRRGRSGCKSRHVAPRRRDDIHLARHPICGEPWQLGMMTVRPPIHDRYVRTLREPSPFLGRRERRPPRECKAPRIRPSESPWRSQSSPGRENGCAARRLRRVLFQPKASARRTRSPLRRPGNLRLARLPGQMLLTVRTIKISAPFLNHSTSPLVRVGRTNHAPKRGSTSDGDNAILG
jgi:hypothetical protein